MKPVLRVIGALIVSIGCSVSTWAADPYSAFDPPVAPALKPAKEALKAYQEAFKGVAINSIHTGTPGYRAMKANLVNTSGKVEVKSYRSLDKGASIETKRDLDFLIDGEGYFLVQLPVGIGYTRDGRMDILKDGRLVTKSSHFPVLSADLSPIKLATSKIIVTQQGHIMQDGSVVGTFGVIGLSKSAPIKSLGGVFLYLSESDRGRFEEVPLYTVKQGFYEDSNVVLSEELVKIPVFKDEQDANAKAAKTIVKSLQTTLSIGRPN